MMAFLRFLIVIPFGFMLACLTAAFALLWPFLQPPPLAGDPLALPAYWLEAAFGFAAQTALVGSTALLPWAGFMAVTEILRLRSLTLHVAAGALGGFAVSKIGYGGEDPQNSVRTALFVAGLSFGLVYWLIAGRAAGRWRERRDPLPPVPPQSSRHIEEV